MPRLCLCLFLRFCYGFCSHKFYHGAGGIPNPQQCAIYFIPSSWNMCRKFQLMLLGSAFDSFFFCPSNDVVAPVLGFLFSPQILAEKSCPIGIGLFFVFPPPGGMESIFFPSEHFFPACPERICTMTHKAQCIIQEKVGIPFYAQQSLKGFK